MKSKAEVFELFYHSLRECAKILRLLKVWETSASGAVDSASISSLVKPMIIDVLDRRTGEQQTRCFELGSQKVILKFLHDF